MSCSELEAEVRAAVVRVVREILCEPHAAVPGHARLARDLDIISEDLSFIFVPDLEKRLGVCLPAETWLQVHTVDDAVARLAEALRCARGQSTTHAGR